MGPGVDAQCVSGLCGEKVRAGSSGSSGKVQALMEVMRSRPPDDSL